MLIQIHLRIKQERNIIFHPHINRIFQRTYLQLRRILIVRSVQGIIQLQQFCPVLINHTEYRIFVVPHHMKPLSCHRIILFHGLLFFHGLFFFHKLLLSAIMRRKQPYRKKSSLLFHPPDPCLLFIGLSIESLNGNRI